ncbi:MAG: hypothetical protein JW727_03110 [Candidatus Aenigmarchaeota archaeon]|nr:hypothetical protein [Candidatus Aenigmarchaeota archaeon]
MAEANLPVPVEPEKQPEEGSCCDNHLHEIAIWLDSYEDIFSDFDPRPNSKRGLSEDFISELKKACLAKSPDPLEVKVYVPESERNETEEGIIKKRLCEYFCRRNKRMTQEYNSIIKKSALMIVAGVVMMLAATYIILTHDERNFITNFLIILLEPGGWFFFWEGLEQAIFEPKKIRSDRDFYKKMSGCNVVFLNDPNGKTETEGKSPETNK